MEIIIKVYTGSGKPVGDTTEDSIEDALEVIQSHLENGNIVIAGAAGDTNVYNMELTKQ